MSPLKNSSLGRTPSGRVPEASFLSIFESGTQVFASAWASVLLIELVTHVPCGIILWLAVRSLSLAWAAKLLTEGMAGVLEGWIAITATAFLVILALVILALVILAQSVALPALVHVYTAKARGQTFSVRTMFRSLWSEGPRFSATYGGALFGLWASILLLSGLMGWLAAHGMVDAVGAKPVVFVLIFFVSTISLASVGLFLLLRCGFAPMLRVERALGFWDALGRSALLMRGRYIRGLLIFLGVLGVSLLLYLIPAFFLSPLELRDLSVPWRENLAQLVRMQAAGAVWFLAVSMLSGAHGAACWTIFWLETEQVANAIG